MAKSREELEEAYQTMCDINADDEVRNYITARSLYESDQTTRRNRMIEQGIEQKTIEMVKGMYVKNIAIETISEISGLSLKEVKEMLNIL